MNYGFVSMKYAMVWWKEIWPPQLWLCLL